MSDVGTASTGGHDRRHPNHTMGMRLERDRLERRLSRVTAALVELQRLADNQRDEWGRPTRPTQRAIGDFQALAATIRARLKDLPPKAPPAQPQHTRSDLLWRPNPRVAHRASLDQETQ